MSTNPIISAVDTAWEDVKNWIEKEFSNGWSFFISFFKEAVKEEEAALFPLFQSQAIQIFNDAVKTAGLTVEQRVALVVTETAADAALDLIAAKTALLNSWAWAIANQQGLINGNQGVLPGGADITPAA